MLRIAAVLGLYTFMKTQFMGLSTMANVLISLGIYILFPILDSVFTPVNDAFDSIISNLGISVGA